MNRFGNGATQTTALSAIPKTRRHPDDAPDQQSLRHSATHTTPCPAIPMTQTTPWSPIPMTQRHPHDALVTNPNDTAPPRRGPGQQSQRHGAAQTTPCPAIPMTQRHPDHSFVSNLQDTAGPIPMTQRQPDDALVSNPNDTAPPRRGPGQQSQRHGATQTTPCSPIPKTRRQTTPCSPILMARRRPDHALVSNPQHTAPPRGRAAQQSPWHSHPRDTPTSNLHGTAPHTRCARRQSPQPATAFQGTAPHAQHAGRSPAAAFQETSAPSLLTSTNPRIPCACHDFATPSARTRARTADFSHRA